VLQAILERFNEWVAPNVTHSCAYTFGCLHPPDILLTQTYLEQFHKIT